MRPGVGPAIARGRRVVAIGGGHGLAATLRALRRVTDDLTAVVGVSDDGGSSGRLRAELGVPPPGDLRQALAALCGDDGWGRTWSGVVQHRFGGSGELAGHSLGNLLIAALWEQTGDVVAGLDWVGALLGAHGRVLPVATQGLDVVALVRGADPTRPDAAVEVRGQVAVATSRGVVERLWLEPADARVCEPAAAAVRAAEAVVLGPGSWYTSVLAPLLVPGLAQALAESRATVVLVLNVGHADRETVGYPPARQLAVLAQQVPGLRVDVVLGDVDDVPETEALAAACGSLDARLLRVPVALRGGGPRHDVDLLASALGRALEAGR